MRPPRLVLKEPEPIWPQAGRYTNYPLPPYRFVRGLNSRPTSGTWRESFGGSDEQPPHVPPELWRENERYLYGIDLYHGSYFWEAHEVWELLWQVSNKEGPEGRFLQGLIQNAAAQIKVHEGNHRGARKLSRAAAKNLGAALDSGACDNGGRFMGIRVAELLKDMEDYYGELWRGHTGGALAVQGRPPRLKLA